MGFKMCGKIFLISMALVFCLHGLSSFGAMGAEIKAIKAPNGRDAILLKGPIEKGDAAKFKRVVSDSHIYEALVLNSVGGNFLEAVKIARYLMKKGIPTEIPEGVECYSACAIIFMAGTIDAGASTPRPVSRYLHYRGKLAFHAPYLEVVEGKYSGATLSKTYRAAILSMRELIKEGVENKPIIPPSLLVEMLSKGPEDSMFVDTVDKAGLWDISIIRFSDKDRYGNEKYPAITRKMFCNACVNNWHWKDNRSVLEHSGDTDCGSRGVPSSAPQGKFQMVKSQGEYFISITISQLKGGYYCKLKVETFASRVRLVTGQFSLSPAWNPNQPWFDNIQLEPFHFYPASTPIERLGSK